MNGGGSEGTVKSCFIVGYACSRYHSPLVLEGGRIYDHYSTHHSLFLSPNVPRKSDGALSPGQQGLAL